MSTHTDTRAGFAKGQAATTRPDFILDEHLTFLDELRESGGTNMWGARPYIEGEYPDMTSAQSSELLSYWMKTFGEETR